ncbi:asparagine synthase-related protein [Luteimonas sp. R10]|uniref:asparagine synthase-related protein n=1 Tax=Luteimonas sp. R10 TaxID=3108176 RepID=UPI0030893EC6|nr:asparagine synthase-related protein [Luteimonas sp. R10]
MSYQYIALVTGTGFAASAEQRNKAASVLSHMGMTAHAFAPNTVVYVSGSTPVLRLPSGGIVVGHVFSRIYAPITHASQLPRIADATRLRRHFVQETWGDYVLFLASGPASISVTRDPSGAIDSLYCIEEGNGFVTSDITLALRLGLYRRRIDWDYIAHRLTFPGLKTARTGLAGVRELLPGNTLTIKPTHTSVDQDWSPWDFVASPRRHTGLEEAAAEVKTAVTGVVSALARTDCTILLELSGGLDSSIVGMCLRGAGARVFCSTIVTPVPGADERMYAGLIAERLGVNLEVCSLDLERSRFRFEPTAHFATPRLGVLHHANDEIMDAVAARHDVSSLYSGAGGDSIFCYLPTAAPAVDAFKDRGLAGGLGSIKDLSDLHDCTYWKAGRLVLKKHLRGRRHRHRPDYRFLDPGTVAGAPERHPWFDAPPGALVGDNERIVGLTSTQLYRDSAARGKNRYLRFPLLSQPVMEACLAAPSWMWIAKGRNRAVARRAFDDVLPPEVLNRRSKGTFRAFLGIYYARNKHEILQYLVEGRLRSRGMLDVPALTRFTRDPLPSRDRDFSRVLDLCLVENWLRHQS